jgi:hypothetical protein
MPSMAKRLKRPRDPVQLAKLIGDIATGQTVDAVEAHPGQEKGGKVGGKARAKSLTPDQRSEIARAAAAARWKKG